jgi:hypothetical protein
MLRATIAVALLIVPALLSGCKSDCSKACGRFAECLGGEPSAPTAAKKLFGESACVLRCEKAKRGPHGAEEVQALLAFVERPCAAAVAEASARAGRLLCVDLCTKEALCFEDESGLPRPIVRFLHEGGCLKRCQAEAVAAGSAGVAALEARIATPCPDLKRAAAYSLRDEVCPALCAKYAECLGGAESLASAESMPAAVADLAAADRCLPLCEAAMRSRGLRVAKGAEVALDKACVDVRKDATATRAPCAELRDTACTKCGKDASACKAATVAPAMGGDVCSAALAERGSAGFCSE